MKPAAGNASPYLDSGALVKLYVLERGSEQVRDAVRKVPRFSLNIFQETEVRTAILAAAGRRVLTTNAANNALANLDEDLRTGRLAARTADWEKAWLRSIELSSRFTRAILCRTLDILHVALAEQAKAATMITGDQRQAELCRRIGIEVTFIRP